MSNPDQTKCHFLGRDGWRLTRMELGVTGNMFVMPDTASFSQNLPLNHTFGRRHFQLVKTTIIHDHKRGEQRQERWYEEI